MVYKWSDKVESFFCLWKICRLPLNAGNEVFSAIGCLWSSLWLSAFCYLRAGSQWVMFIMCYCPSLADTLTSFKQDGYTYTVNGIPFRMWQGIGSSVSVHARPIGPAVSAAAVIRFLDRMRASCLSSFLPIPSKASLSPLEPLPRSIQHVESWSRWSMRPAACPLPCDLPILSAHPHALELLTMGKQNTRVSSWMAFSFCAYINIYAYIHMHTYVFIRSNQ